MIMIFDDEDNESMNEQLTIEYTGYINGKLFRETGNCIVEGVKKHEERESAQKNMEVP